MNKHANYGTVATKKLFRYLTSSTLLVRSKYAMWQSISHFLNPIPKYYFLYTSTVASAYFLRSFTVVLLPLCLQKYRLKNICFSIVFHHSSLFTCRSEFDLFVVVPCLHFHSHLDYSHSYKVRCKYACMFISNTVKIQLQCGKSTANVRLQIG